MGFKSHFSLPRLLPGNVIKSDFKFRREKQTLFTPSLHGAKHSPPFPPSGAPSGRIFELSQVYGKSVILFNLVRRLVEKGGWDSKPFFFDTFAARECCYQVRFQSHREKQTLFTPSVHGAKHSPPFPPSGVPFGENFGVVENILAIDDFLQFGQPFDRERWMGFKTIFL